MEVRSGKINKNIKATIFAVLAAALYALNVPFSKVLLENVAPTMMAAFLYLGVAKTSAFYSVAPFSGVSFSMIILKERPALQFFAGFVIMLVATLIMVKDTISSEES